MQPRNGRQGSRTSNETPFGFDCSTALFDVDGASAATRGKNLDRQRNARTLSSHNPASYKAQALGAYELHGTRLPTLGFF